MNNRVCTAAIDDRAEALDTSDTCSRTDLMHDHCIHIVHVVTHGVFSVPCLPLSRAVSFDKQLCWVLAGVY